MSEVLFVSLLVLLAIAFAILFWLVHEQKKLQQLCMELEKAVNRNSKDIAGICSAAVAVDSRMQGNDQRIKDIVAKLNEYEKQRSGTTAEASSTPYHLAIRKIHHGASAEQLVREFGLSRDEALLLVSLHGGKS